jgi:hypothetical protein
MTEAEWLACSEPAPMLDLLRDQASKRKFQLFACGGRPAAWSCSE